MYVMMELLSWYSTSGTTLSKQVFFSATFEYKIPQQRICMYTWSCNSIII